MVSYILAKNNAGGSSSAVSPTAKVTETDDGAVITITDAEGTTTVTIKHGTDGQDGAAGAKGDTGAQGPKGDKRNIRRSDKARAAYYKHISGNRWGDARNYELIVDSSVGIEKSVETILRYVNDHNTAIK